MDLGFFNKYPYTDFHELNLDWIIAALKQYAKELQDFVQINAIKYADPLQWDITRQYEKNTVVIDPLTGTAYISVQPVPAGVSLARPEYWTVIFDLSVFITAANNNFTVRVETVTTTTATFNTAAGEWLIWDQKLYKANVNITAGDAYVEGGNITRWTVEQGLQDLNTALAALAAVVGDLNDLTTTDKSSIVNAINDVVSALTTVVNNIGDLATLTTVDQSNIVNAINELVTSIAGVVNSIGDLATLTTTDQSSIVNAINELVTDYTGVVTSIGDLATLTTTDKTNIVNAINELVSTVGDLSTLTTVDQSSIVTAINELVTSLAGVVNSIGDLATLTTTDQSSIVNAINEVNAKPAGAGQMQTTRPKLGWYSGQVLRAYADTFSMNGFRYLGQYYKQGSKIYHPDAVHRYLNCIIGNINDDLEVINVPQHQNWYGAFAVPTTGNECRMSFSPILRVTSVSGDTLSLGSTEEATIAGTLTSSLLDVTGRDVLLITSSGVNLCGAVLKVVSNTTNTVTLDNPDSITIQANDYLMIAPADEYCYIASHYYDASEWRNRQDNGFGVKSYNVAHPEPLTLHSTDTLINYNDFSPMASGVIFTIAFTVATSATGGVYIHCGADDLHIITEYNDWKTTNSSEALYSNAISIFFDYRQSVAVQADASTSIRSNTTTVLHFYGWYE